MDWRDLFDTGILRYGVTTAEKEKLARERALPGAPRDPSAAQAAADRYAAGYLFGTYWPRAAPVLMPWISAAKTSGWPLIGGENPALQSLAEAGLSRALIDAANRYKAEVNRSERPWEDYRSAEAERIRRRRPTAAAQAEALEE